MPKKNKSNESTDLISKLISKEMVSYIIVNNDLNMSKGKIASQVAHGILDVHRFLLSKNISHDQWSNNGEKIVVVKTGQSNILNIYRQFQDQIPEKNTFNVFPIYDAGRTEVATGSLTILACTPISSDKVPDEIKILKLL